MLVTGVRSGIGLRLARRLWQTRYRVIATARPSSLSDLAGEPFVENERFLIRALDVTDPKSRRAVVDEATATWGGVDILVNNAGISYRSVLEHMSAEDHGLQLATNFIGPMDLTRLVLPGMRARRRGRIINISSVGGMMAMPTMGAYSGSKFALEGASEALWYEVRPWNIHVTLIRPGFVHSKAFQRVAWSDGARASAENGGEYAPCYKEMSSFIARLMHRARATPEGIAECVLRVMADPAPPLRKNATIDAHFFSALRRVLPRRLYHAILYRALPNIGSWDGNGRDHGGTTP